MQEGGKVSSQTINLPPNGRATIDANQVIPNAALSARVACPHSRGTVMYFSNGNGGTNTIGIPVNNETIQTILDLYDTLIWLDVQNPPRQRCNGAVPQMPSSLFGVVQSTIGCWGRLGIYLIGSTVSEPGISPNSAMSLVIERQRLNSRLSYTNTVKVLERLAANGYRLGFLSNASMGPLSLSSFGDR